jgi:hypothetical protein
MVSKQIVIVARTSKELNKGGEINNETERMRGK